jgi:hypothetical protein
MDRRGCAGALDEPAANQVKASAAASGPNPDSLLGGRTSASAECRHWSGRAGLLLNLRIPLSQRANLLLRPLARLAQDEKPGVRGGAARGGGRLGKRVLSPDMRVRSRDCGPAGRRHYAMVPDSDAHR